MSNNPILVEVTRGPAVESRHRGAFVVADANGKIVHSAGDPEMNVFPRSSAKPLQALPLIETGAADRFGLGNKEIALACASHKSEPEHVTAVKAWLAKLGLDHNALECGTHSPGSAKAAVDIIRSGATLTAAHHNCSGKHTGFLSACVVCGNPARGYIEADHPAQKRVTAALGEMTGCDLSRVPLGRDGCGIPVYHLPLRNLAWGMARLADPSHLLPTRAEAAVRIRTAMMAEPFYVNGTGGFTTEAMRAAPHICVKGGFEGVYTAALPELGLGIALKIDDGTMRAAEFTMAHILKALSCFNSTQERILAGFLRPHILTNAGREAGLIKPTQALEFARS